MFFSNVLPLSQYIDFDKKKNNKRFLCVFFCIVQLTVRVFYVFICFFIYT